MTEDLRRHLKTLGLEPGATAADIKMAYRELAVIWHPDRYVNVPQLRDVAQSKMAEINAAYQYLKTHVGEAGTGSVVSSWHPRTSTPNNAPSGGSRSSAEARTASSRDAFRRDASYRDTPGGPPAPPLQPLHVLRVPITPDSRAVTGVGIAPNGSRIVAVSGAYALWWSTHTGHKVSEEQAAKGTFSRLAVSPNGRYLALANNRTGWLGSRHCEIQVCDLQTGNERYRIKSSGPIGALAFSPDSKQLTGGDENGEIHFWEAETGRVVQTITTEGGADEIRRVAYVDSGQAGKQVITLKVGKILNEIVWWDVRRAKRLKEFTLHVRECLTYGQISDLSPSPDGRLLLVANNDAGNRNYTLHLWDMQTGRAVKPEAKPEEKVTAKAETAKEARGDGAFRGHTEEITVVEYGPEGKFILSGSMDRTVRLWDARTGKEIARGLGHERPIRSLAFSADGALAASGSEEGAVRVWKLPE